jgi:hypothetical protein
MSETIQIAWVVAAVAVPGIAIAARVLSRLVVELRIPPVPLQDVEVPVDATIVLDGAIDVDVEVPFEAVLTAKDLGLERLTVPIDTAVLVEETIEIATTVAIDASVTSVLGVSVPVKGNLPIRATVPIRQKVRVKDTIEVSVEALRIPLRAVVPLRTKVPIRQPIKVNGRVRLADGSPVQLGAVRIKAANVKLRLD